MSNDVWSVTASIARAMADPQFGVIEGRVAELMVKYGPDVLAAYAVELVAAERERCAKIAEDWDGEFLESHPQSEIADRIRSGQ
jgi:hypothetical protein